MNPSLLDTDVVSRINRGDPIAVTRAAEYVGMHLHLSFSQMTRFEVLRGLFAKRATRQIEWFEEACTKAEILPITTEILDRAAVIWGDLHRAGRLIPDADLIIGVTALVHGLEMVTNNVRHFSRIPGLTVVNWLEA